MAGERLGILGSILIDETVFKALRSTATKDGSGAAHAEETHFDGISSMSDIVRFVHSRARLDESVVPFVRLARARPLSRVPV
jgi:hypothetical protein